MPSLLDTLRDHQSENIGMIDVDRFIVAAMQLAVAVEPVLTCGALDRTGRHNLVVNCATLALAYALQTPGEALDPAAAGKLMAERVGSVGRTLGEIHVGEGDKISMNELLIGTGFISFSAEMQRALK